MELNWFSLGFIQIVLWKFWQDRLSLFHLNRRALLAAVETVVALEIVVHIVGIPLDARQPQRPIVLAPNRVDAESEPGREAAPAARGTPPAPVGVLSAPERIPGGFVPGVHLVSGYPVNAPPPHAAAVVVERRKNVGRPIAKTGAARARADGHLVRLKVAVGPFDLAGGRELVGRIGVAEVDGVAVDAQASSVRCGVQSVVPLDVFGLHGHEAQDEEVHATGHHSQSEQNKDD